MSTYVNPLTHVIPVDKDDMVVTVRGKDIPFREIGADEIAVLVNRVPAARAEVLGQGNIEVSEAEKNAVQIEFIAIGLAGINVSGVEYEATKASIAALSRFERDLIMAKMMNFIMPEAVIEEAVGNAPKAVKTKTAKAPTRPRMGKIGGR